MKLIGTRSKKVELSNDFSVTDNFQLNPMINFNYAKLDAQGIPAGVSAYSVMVSVVIEGSAEVKSPIRVNILVESLFEFSDGESEAEIMQLLKDQAFEQVYIYARSLLASLTLISGIRPIALPDRDKLSQGVQA